MTDKPYIFVEGTRAVADQVNANFDACIAGIQTLETDMSEVQSQLSTGIILPDGSVDFTGLQSYKIHNINNATNATPIVITAVAHGYVTGDKVQIKNVEGNTAANGTWTITKIGADTFSLDSSVGNGTYTSGTGTAIIVPVADGNLISKAYLDENAGALKISALSSVSSNITLANNTVTTADISGSITVTLPETLISGNENVVVLDFSTTSSSSPAINMTATTRTITAASNATPIVVTASAHEYVTGDVITISGVGGNTAANGLWTITRLTDNTFSLNGSIGNGTYTSGGTAIKTNIRWSNKNNGKAPTAYSTISGVRNVLVFKTHDNGLNWEAEYSTYGAIELDFDQPVLSANGTLGGSSFAVQPSTTSGVLYGYYVSDRNTSTRWGATAASGNIILYNPLPIKATGIYLHNGIILAYTIAGSNDNTTYTVLASGTATNGITQTLSIPSGMQNYYKYYRLAFTTTAGAADGYIYELQIIGTYISA